MFFITSGIFYHRKEVGKVEIKFKLMHCVSNFYKGLCKDSLFKAKKNIPADFIIYNINLGQPEIRLL